MKRGRAPASLLAPLAVLLVLAACHADDSDSGEARELNQAAASIDINATAPTTGGDQQENGQ